MHDRLLIALREETRRLFMSSLAALRCVALKCAFVSGWALEGLIGHQPRGHLKGGGEEETYCPAVDHHEGLRVRVEVALRDGFWPAGGDVALVFIWVLCGAQGELGHDVGEVADPLSRGGQGGAGQGGGDCWKTSRSMRRPQNRRFRL